MYTRILENKLKEHLFLGKAIIVYGPRQVGKTTLLKSLISKLPGKRVSFLSCDEPQNRNALSGKSSIELRSYIGDVDIVVIDEAQLVENIGLTIKLLVDNYPKLQVIATGSSSFDLANKITEPLTGRAFEFSLYSFSLQELELNTNRADVMLSLERFLTYGLYPAVVINPELAKKNISLITGGFLYKDLLAYGGIRKPELLEKILRNIAHSEGRELPISTIAQNTDGTQPTVESYITLLEQAHLIIKLSGFHNNPLLSIRKQKKYFITDVGLSNTFWGENLNLEAHIGRLFESMCIMERIKFHTNNGRIPNLFFWRNDTNSEIDLVDKTIGFEKVFEFTWSPNKAKKKKTPNSFKKMSDLPVTVICKENFWEIYQ
ncbi:ATP-binding protein [Candidatus Nomurabacteria bacterium]|nr:ATP-binding protein [Candidatus Nomurabacteria bacterium]